MILSSPYRGLPASAFWRTGLAETSYPPPDLYVPRIHLTRRDRIVTAGSCFAQHVGRTLRANGFNVLDKEPVSEDPRPIADQEAAYGYGLYTGRYGNIYTARQLKQILLESLGRSEPADLVWQRNGRFFDSMRPNIEPEGFESEAALRAARDRHLSRVREAFLEADVFVFTLGLTEAWLHRPSGQVYATAPGTIADSYDPEVHMFHNFRHHEIMADLRDTWQILTGINPGLRMLLTVSPVPLTATASGDHVLAATTYSKSVLRACAGEMRADHSEIDYFPSYEIITSVRAGAAMFEDNLRSVTADGVALAMKTFVDAQLAATPPEVAPARPAKTAATGGKGASKANDAAGPATEVAGILVPASPISDRRDFQARAAGLGSDKPDEVACAEAVLRPGDRVLEIGARLGIVSAYLAKTGQPAAIRVYEDKTGLIEPIRGLYAANGVADAIDLRHATVLPRAGAIPAGKRADTKFVSLDEIVAEFRPDLLVMNTKGDEGAFLRKADLSSLRSLAIRWHPKLVEIEALRACKRHLKGLDFQVLKPVSTRVSWAATRPL